MNQKKNLIVLGGGVGGLSAAWMFSRAGDYNITVIEKKGVVGGTCATFNLWDSMLDYGPHKFYSLIPEVMTEVEKLMGSEFIRIKKRNKIMLRGQLLDYPFKILSIINTLNLVDVFRIGSGAVYAAIKKPFCEKEPYSFEEYCINKFGVGLYSIIFQPLAEKVWGDPKNLSSDISKARIPSKNLLDIILRIMGLRKENRESNADFFFYPHKGYGRICERMKEEVQNANGIIYLNSRVIDCKLKGSKIVSVIIEDSGRNQKELPADLIISSISLKDLIAILLEHFPQEKACEIQKLSETIKFRTAFLVYLLCDGDQYTNDHWIFFPEKKYIFSRIFENKLFDREMVPKGYTVIGCDFTDFEDGCLSSKSDKELAFECEKGLIEAGLLPNGVVKDFHVIRIPDFYPCYNVDYKDKLYKTQDIIGSIENIILTGRLGYYNYNNLDHCVDMAMFIVSELSTNSTAKEINKKMLHRVTSYRIVD